jgi:hypothetical protein
MESGEKDHLRLYSSLRKSSNYIKIKDLQACFVYYIVANNSRLGIWLPKYSGFVISRIKFDNNYLFLEYHCDAAHFPTVKPFSVLEESPFSEERLYFKENGNSNDAGILAYLNNLLEKHQFEEWEKFER